MVASARSMQVNWASILLILVLLFAFSVGGASREALAWHSLLNAVCWIASSILVAQRWSCLALVVPRQPIFLLVALFMWSLFTIVPLPSSLFDQLNPIFGNVVNGNSMLEVETPFLTFSASPFQTLRSLSAFGLPVFGVLSVALMPLHLRRALLQIIVVLGSISILIGFAQITGGRNSTLYFWEVTNRGAAVGIFANANHQTGFLATLIPLIYYSFLMSLGYLQSRSWQKAATFAFLCLFAFTVGGVIAGGSLAGIILTGFSITFSLVFIKPPDIRRLKIATSFPLISSLVASSAFVYYSILPNLRGRIGTNLNEGELSRVAIYTRSLEIWKDNWFFGTGFGSFPIVYPLYEDPETVPYRFVNHAHNDLLEWVVELGVPGALLLILFSLWLGRHVLSQFTKKAESRETLLSRAAAISALVLILHSVVDYPLRTPFLLLVFFILLTVIVTTSYRST